MQIPRGSCRLSAVIGLTALVSTAALAASALNAKLKAAKEFDSALWDQAARELIKKDDPELLRTMLSAKTKGGNPASERRFRLFDVYREKPEFYVREAKAHFKGNLDCAVEVLVPASRVIEPADVINVAVSAEKSGKASPDLKLFRTRAEEQAKAVGKKTSVLKLESCGG